ncbi:MAG: hypothetical protein GY951_01100, partial [Psychromonas sp.]|nr:hypothetical protein [Psychromonas sp.]
EGSRDVNFDVQRIDELGDLSCDFNDTVRALAENEAELKKYQQGLELIVEERTVELEASNSELLRANELILLHNEQIEGAYESLKKMQKQLVETEKMSALAYLVTGIAHELNTPLGIAYTANSCTENRLGDLKNYLSSEAISKKQILEYIQEALDATNLTTKNIQRSTLLVDRFKELDAQRHNYHIETINIKEHVNGVLLNRHIEDLRPAITVKVDIDDELNLLGNRKQFEQFLFHLFENSIVHAFENIEDRQISVSAFRDQDKIEFVYQDNGIGMAKEQVEKIFNPFYTSKLGSGSSGLGMNVVYNIIKHSFNGDISCHSELGKGTMLKVVFYTEIDYVDNL